MGDIAKGYCYRDAANGRLMARAQLMDGGTSLMYPYRDSAGRMMFRGENADGEIVKGFPYRAIDGRMMVRSVGGTQPELVITFGGLSGTFYSTYRNQYGSYITVPGDWSNVYPSPSTIDRAVCKSSPGNTYYAEPCRYSGTDVDELPCVPTYPTGGLFDGYKTSMFAALHVQGAPQPSGKYVVFVTLGLLHQDWFYFSGDTTYYYGSGGETQNILFVKTYDSAGDVPDSDDIPYTGKVDTLLGLMGDVSSASVSISGMRLIIV